MLTLIPLLATAASAFVLPNANHQNPFQSPLLTSPEPLHDEEAQHLSTPSWFQSHLESVQDIWKDDVKDSLETVWADAGAVKTTVADKLNEIKTGFFDQVDSIVEEAGKPRHGRGHKSHDLTNYTIYELIHSSNYTKRFAALVDEHEDIVSLLNSTKSNHTLFVPIDSAFKKIPDDAEKPGKEFLEAVLKYHIGENEFPAKAILHASTLPTLLEEKLLNGPQRLRVSAGLFGVKLNFYSKVVAADFKAGNGIIHAVDSILVPPPFIGAELNVFPQVFSTLLLAIKKTDFQSYLHSITSTGSTYFAPTNKAFSRLGVKANAFLFGTEKGSKYLKALLKYHIAPNATLYSDAFYNGVKSESRPSQHYELSTLLKGTAIGVDLSKWLFFRRYKINGSVSPVITDGVAKNGVIHVIPSILIPPHSTRQSEVSWEDGITDLTVEELVDRLDPYVDEE